jgi:hydroxymethylpyrimidine pyrophosphatase-like HAD family hydrolase
MGNATEDAKAAADYVTDDVDHDGIMNALTHFSIL